VKWIGQVGQKRLARLASEYLPWLDVSQVRSGKHRLMIAQLKQPSKLELHQHI
jgi:hypothetical protein